jgi:hypothetical protein
VLVTAGEDDGLKIFSMLTLAFFPWLFVGDAALVTTVGAL